LESGGEGAGWGTPGDGDGDESFSLPSATECDLISESDPAWTVCAEGEGACKASFTNGVGCDPVCAAAGLECLFAFALNDVCLISPLGSIGCEHSDQFAQALCHCGTGTAGGEDASPPGISRLRVVTEESPSWVAWHEIEVRGRWSSNPEGASFHLPLDAVVATSETAEGPAALAVDGDLGTSWNAGDFPDASITLEFTDSVIIDEVRLLVAQLPPGATRHVIDVESEGGNFEALHVFEGFTSSGDWLTWNLATPTDTTDPSVGCSGCLGEQATCVAACNNIGYDTGVCVSPGSTDPASCCSCSNDAPPASGGDGFDPQTGAFSLDEVTWLHVNVQDWPVTANLSSVSIEGGVICLEYDKANAWPSVDIPHNSGNGDVAVVANPWVFMEYNGQWYAGTWEWMGVGQVCKNKASVAGDHIKQPPLGPADWKPASGQELYFMVSGLARFSNIANVSERSNIVKVVWP
jgi:hypothetical protein